MIFPNLSSNLSCPKTTRSDKCEYLSGLPLDLNAFLPYFCGLYSIPKIQVQNLQVQPVESHGICVEFPGTFRNPIAYPYLIS